MRLTYILGILLIVSGVIISIAWIGPIFGLPVIVIGIFLLGYGWITGIFSGSSESTNPIEYTIPPGDFTWDEFSTGKESILTYTLEVQDGPPVNAILTDATYIDEFSESPDIGWVQKGSVLNVEKQEVSVEIPPRDYALIIDNTGRLGDQESTETAQVELQRQISG